MRETGLFGQSDHLKRLLADGDPLVSLFEDFDRHLKARNYLAIGGQIIDATPVAAPKQPNATEVKATIKGGKGADEI